MYTFCCNFQSRVNLKLKFLGYNEKIWDFDSGVARAFPAHPEGQNEKIRVMYNVHSLNGFTGLWCKSVYDNKG